MNMTTLKNLLRNAIHDDSDTQTWCTTQYTRNHKVYVGIDTRKPPNKDDCPLVMLAMDGKTEGYALDEQDHFFGVACEIYNSDLATTGKTNVVEYQGIDHIETFRQYVLTAVAAVIPAGFFLQTVETEFSQIEFFPFFDVAMILKISTIYSQGGDPLA